MSHHYVAPHMIALGLSSEGDSCEFGSQKYFLLCGFGGILSCGTTHTAVVPLDLIKCRLQVCLHSVWDNRMSMYVLWILSMSMFVLWCFVLFYRSGSELRFWLLKILCSVWIWGYPELWHHSHGSCAPWSGQVPPTGLYLSTPLQSKSWYRSTLVWVKLLMFVIVSFVFTYPHHLLKGHACWLCAVLVYHVSQTNLWN